MIPHSRTNGEVLPAVAGASFEECRSYGVDTDLYCDLVSGSGKQTY